MHTRCTKNTKETVDNYVLGNRNDFVEMMKLLLNNERWRSCNRQKREGQEVEREPWLGYKGVNKSTETQPSFRS